MIHHSRRPRPEIPETDLPGFVLEGAQARGAHLALRDSVTGESLTYAGLADAVDGASQVLRNAGVAPGSVVVLMSPNQPWWVVTYYAVLRCGGVVTPVNPASTPEEISRIVTASGAEAAVVDAGSEAQFRAAVRLDGPHRPHVTVLLIGGDGPDDLRRAVATGGPAPHEVAAAVPRPGDLAALPFSSGTTGLPKGVMLTHRNLVATIVQHAGIYHVGTDDVVLAALPMFHIYGMSIVTNYAIRHGATIVTMPRFDLDRFVELVASEGVTWLHLAPPIALLLGRLPPGLPALASVRRAISGAAPLDAAVQRRAEAVLGCAIGQGYGMTEASPGVTFVADDPAEPASPQGSVGILVAGTEARLVDPATGRDVEPDGTRGGAGPGELWVRGPQVMAGYLNAPDATDATIVEDGWLRTGDMARVDADGTWWIVDRLKELIKYKGYQVAPAELEALLLTHPDIDDAAVAGRPDPSAGEIPVGFVVLRPGAALTPADIAAWVAVQVTPYKKLRAVVLVERIPKSPSGKLLRRELRRLDAETSAATPSP